MESEFTRMLDFTTIKVIIISSIKKVSGISSTCAFFAGKVEKSFTVQPSPDRNG